MENKIRQFAELMSSEKIFNPKGSLGTPKRLLFYLDNLFKDIDLKDKTVLDVGAGYGLFSIYMSLNGARHIISLEPELDGGTNRMTNTFKSMMETLGIDNIEIKKKTFQDYDEQGKKFDLLFLHNSINHLNEEACESILVKQESYDVYLQYFRRLYDMNTPGGQLFIADCSNRNFFGDLNLKSPLAPSIEWEKHLGPDQWSKLAVEAGYRNAKTNWTSISNLGTLGKLLMANKLMAYFTLSHFNICFSKESGRQKQKKVTSKVVKDASEAS